MHLPEVYVNGKLFPITVDEDRKIGIYDIIMGVENWLYDNKLYLLKIFFDGEEITSEDMIDTIDPSIVQRIDIYAGEILEFLLFILQEMGAIIDGYGDFTNEEDESDINELADWIGEPLSKAFFIIKKRGKGVIEEDFLKQLEKYEEGLKTIKDKNKEEKISILKEIKEILPKVYNKLQEKYFIPNWQKLEDMEKEFSSIKDIIKESASFIQQGKEEEGLSRLQILLEYLMKYHKIVSWATFTEILEDKKEIMEKLPDYYNKMREHLYEFDEAFRNKDFVLISDMLEYETPEILDNIKGFIKAIVFEGEKK